MTNNPTPTPEPEEPVRIKLSGDMQDTGSDVFTINGEPDVVVGDAAEQKDSDNG